MRRLWIGLKRTWNDLRRTVQRWQADDGSLMAASVAYYTALSFFPLLLVLISGLGLFLQVSAMGQSAEQQVVTAISEYASQEVASDVGDMLYDVRRKAAVGGPLGLLVLLFGAMTLFANFEKAFDRIWNTPTPSNRGLWGTIRNVLFVRLRAFILLVGVGVLILLVFATGFVLSSIRVYGEHYLPITNIVWPIVQSCVTIALNTCVFAFLFRYLPRVQIHWREALRGAFLTAATWEIGRMLLATFLIGNKFSAYGVVGSFLAVMIWIYYAACVVFLGAEYIQVICEDCNPAPSTETSRRDMA